MHRICSEVYTVPPCYLFIVSYIIHAANLIAERRGKLYFQEHEIRILLLFLEMQKHREHIRQRKLIHQIVLPGICIKTVPCHINIELHYTAREAICWRLRNKIHRGTVRLWECVPATSSDCCHPRWNQYTAEYIIMLPNMAWRNVVCTLLHWRHMSYQYSMGSLCDAYCVIIKAHTP